MTNPNINDDLCVKSYCGLCEVPAPVRRVTVRGLCKLSIFDRCFPLHICFHNQYSIYICKHLSCLVPEVHMVLLHATRVYNYIINEDGQPMFVGSHTSVLLYNRSISSWVWYGQYPQL